LFSTNGESASRSETNFNGLNLVYECTVRARQAHLLLGILPWRFVLRDIPLLVGGTAQRSSMALTAPKDILAGHQQKIQADRDLILETAREQRKKRLHWAA
jgi:hypothetical protein